MLSLIINENLVFRVTDFNCNYTIYETEDIITTVLNIGLKDGLELKNNITKEIVDQLQSEIVIYKNGKEYIVFEDFSFADFSYFENETEDANTQLHFNKTESLSMK